MQKYHQHSLLFALGVCLSAPVFADHPIAKPKIYQGKVETAIVWIEPVTMQPSVTMDTGGKKATIHNEVDQHAVAGNKMGFGSGGWIPNCEVACTISKRNSKWKIVFPMMSMVANDGPHYGRNVALDGPGIYDEICQIDPPDWRGFFRHTDKESGVGAFFEPYSVKGSFTFTGTGKAGGY